MSLRKSHLLSLRRLQSKVASLKKNFFFVLIFLGLSEGATPKLGRTRRSLSVANLRDRISGKSDQRKSMGTSTSDAIPQVEAAPPVGEVLVGRLRSGSKADLSGVPRGDEERVVTVAASAGEVKKTLARPADDSEALLAALSSCSASLARALGSSSKAARLLGGAAGTRGRAGSASAGQTTGEAAAVLEAAVALGEAVASLTSRLGDSPGAAACAREVLARYKMLDDALVPLGEKAEEWREVRGRKKEQRKKEEANLLF